MTSNERNTTSIRFTDFDKGLFGYAYLDDIYESFTLDELADKLRTVVVGANFCLSQIDFYKFGLRSSKKDAYKAFCLFMNSNGLAMDLTDCHYDVEGDDNAQD